MHGAHHVLLHSADRNAHAFRNVAVRVPLKATENEDCTSPFGQAIERGYNSLQRLSALDDSSSIEVRFAVLLSIEQNVVIGVSNSSPTVPIGKHASGSLEDIAAEVVDHIRRVASSDAQEDFLHEILDLVRVAGPAPEETKKGVTENAGLGNKASTAI
jgi:hypothetical protein